MYFFIIIILLFGKSQINAGMTKICTTQTGRMEKYLERNGTYSVLSYKFCDRKLDCLGNIVVETIYDENGIKISDTKYVYKGRGYSSITVDRNKKILRRLTYNILPEFPKDTIIISETLAPYYSKIIQKKTGGGVSTEYLDRNQKKINSHLICYENDNTTVEYEIEGMAKHVVSTSIIKSIGDFNLDSLRSVVARTKAANIMVTYLNVNQKPEIIYEGDSSGFHFRTAFRYEPSGKTSSAIRYSIDSGKILSCIKSDYLTAEDIETISDENYITGETVTTVKKNGILFSKEFKVNSVLKWREVWQQNP